MAGNQTRQEYDADEEIESSNRDWDKSSTI
jgi:hypothetical protein